MKEKFITVGLTKDTKPSRNIPDYDTVYIGFGKGDDATLIFMTPAEMQIFIAEASMLLAKNDFLKHTD